VIGIGVSVSSQCQFANVWPDLTRSLRGRGRPPDNAGDGRQFAENGLKGQGSGGGSVARPLCGRVEGNFVSLSR
jgi:hypothetical protein